MKLFVQMLTTLGYASVGTGLADPLFKTGKLGLANVLVFGAGLVALAPALYYVPDGDDLVSH